MILGSPVEVDEPVMFAAPTRDADNDVLVTIDSARPVDRRAARAADELGLSATSIERMPFDLSVLDSGGVFINVEASNFGLLDRRLDWQALGITLPRRADLAFHPPRCGLVPDRYRLPLLRPAAQAHTALHRYSYHFRLVETLFETPAYRWLPWKAWPEFERAFAGACARLAEALDAYEANFGSIRETVLAAFSQLAADSTRRLEATGHPVSNDFADFVLRGVMTALPTPETLREKLSLRYRVGVIQLGSDRGRSNGVRQKSGVALKRSKRMFGPTNGVGRPKNDWSRNNSGRSSNNSDNNGWLRNRSGSVRPRSRSNCASSSSRRLASGCRSRSVHWRKAPSNCTRSCSKPQPHSGRPFRRTRRCADPPRGKRGNFAGGSRS